MFNDDMNGATEVTLGDAPETVTQDDLSTELAAANAKAEENYNKFLLAMADFENYKRRMERDNAALYTAYRRGLLERFLPVIDNLERALQFDATSDGLRGGVEQTLKGFESILFGQDVRAIDVAGKPFDPRIAEAIGTAPADDGIDDDTVVAIAQKGYTIGDELLRPAQVIVAKSLAP
ncbi:MAG TPA: nucleotide exchange factor GrpE [Verrucomicrobiae bacterium]|jgi:molecular chaperone GrpE|nr:nucleotide exchange factor GrpE [Verrucomicrobiae bacterium]